MADCRQALPDDRRVTADLTTLRTENDNLKAAVTDLRKNLEELRARLAASTILPPVRKLVKKRWKKCGPNLNRRLTPKCSASTPG